jgi:acetyl-CoA acetyltransferase
MCEIGGEVIVNAEGGAIARAQPIGATEAVLTGRIIDSMRHDGFGRGIGGEDIALETIA